MSENALELPASFQGEARLFPLPGHVMFPGNILPLHIFESRYVEMMQDALEDDRLIAMATLLPGYEHDYYTRPPVATAICIGRVTAHERTEQGTYNLLLLGLQRARIEHEIEPVRSFRRAKVEVLPEEDSGRNAKSEQLGMQLAKRIEQALPPARPLVEKFAAGSLSLATLTDLAAFHLPLPMDVKLRLLAETSAFARATLIMDRLPASPKHDSRRSWNSIDFSEN
jgi:ATP-dependent Lon protease